MKTKKNIKKAASLKDIAEEVKVSKTAVSKVLNNISIRISDKKRKEIIEVARRLNYRPNIIARSLQNRKTRSIGIVVPDISTLFFPQLIRVIESKLFSKGYQTIICNTSDDAGCERKHIENLTARLVDGFVVAPAATTGKGNLELFRQIKGNGVPFIFIDRYLADAKDFDFIITDNEAGAKLGADILIEKGVKKIIYVGEMTRNAAIDDRLSGVKNACSERGIKFYNTDTFFCGTDRVEIKKRLSGIFYEKELEDAGIFLESNRFFMGILDIAREKGFRIPEDINVIGFDAFEPEVLSGDDFESIMCLSGPIPVIKQDIDRMGKLVSEYLLSSIENKEQSNLWQIKLPAKIGE